MRLRLESERPRIVVFERDSVPEPGEARVERILAGDNESYYSKRGGAEEVVAADPYFSRPKEQRFVLEKGRLADRLISALREGPIKPHYRLGEVSIDLDRIERPVDRTKKAKR